MAVEQLHYTWAPRGVEGVNRFQIAAMSAGFRSGDVASALSQVRALCRYDPPGGEERRPVSFGWLDHGPRRIAFHRVALPAGTDRAGNFAAHLLVGTPGTLPEAAVASSFGSPLWWRGLTAEERADIDAGKREFELPPLQLQDLVDSAPDPACGGEETMALLYELLRLPGGEKVEIAAEGEPLALALSSVARLLPEALRGFTVSTYEGKAIYPFRLLGAVSPGGRARRCELSLPESLEAGERETLGRLISTDPAATELRNVVGRSGRHAQEEAQTRMWATACLLVGLEHGEQLERQVERGLQVDPEVVGFLARTQQGRDTLARWTQAGGAVVEGLKAAAARIEAGCRDALYRAMGDRYADSKLTGCATAVAAMAPGQAREQVLDQLLEAALNEESAAALDAEDAALVIRHAAGQGRGSSAVRPLLRGAVRHIPRCAGDPEVPDAYLATMFEIGLADPTAWRALSEATVTRPRFLKEVTLAGTDEDRCLELLERIDHRGREAALPVLLPQLGDGEPAERAFAIVRRLPPVVAAGVLLEASRSQELRPSQLLDSLCDELGATLLERREETPSLQVLALSNSADGVLASALLRRLHDGGGGAPADIAVESNGIGLPALRHAVRRLALDRAATGLRSLAEVERLWQALGALYANEDGGERLRRLLREGAIPPPDPADVLILAWVGAMLLEREPALVSRLGALKDRQAEAAAMSLAAGADAGRMAEMSSCLEDAPGRARRWWRKLEAHSKKGGGIGV